MRSKKTNAFLWISMVYKKYSKLTLINKIRWIHLRSATRFMDCINTSLGVLNPNRFRGRLFN